MSTTASFIIKGIEEKIFFSHDGYSLEDDLEGFVKKYSDLSQFKHILPSIICLLENKDLLRELESECKDDFRNHIFSADDFVDRKVKINKRFSAIDEQLEDLGNEILQYARLAPERWHKNVEYIYEYDFDNKKFVKTKVNEGIVLEKVL